MFLLSSFFFFYFAGVGVYVIFLPKILNLAGYAPVQIGFLFSAVPLMRFLTPFLFLKIFALTKKVYQYSLLVSLLIRYLPYITFIFYFLILHYLELQTVLVCPILTPWLLKNFKHIMEKVDFGDRLVL